METQYTTMQEVLFNIHSNFCKRECNEEKYEWKEAKSVKERLKILCWEGMIPELPAGVRVTENGHSLILWEMMALNTILHLKMGGYSQRLDPEWALHPYLIMDTAVLN
jgi:hypothetical protein